MTTNISSTEFVDKHVHGMPSPGPKFDSKKVTVVFVLGGPGSGTLFHPIVTLRT